MLSLRNLVLPFAMWWGVLQSLMSVHDSTPSSPGLLSLAQLVGFASVLGSLTVLVYRLGVWRQEMENTKHNVGAEVKAHRDESAANFDRLERRLEAIDHLITVAAEHRMRAARWQSRTERRLARLEVGADVDGVQ
jgi:hypothetical protein